MLRQRMGLGRIRVNSSDMAPDQCARRAHRPGWRRPNRPLAMQNNRQRHPDLRRQARSCARCVDLRGCLPQYRLRRERCHVAVPGRHGRRWQVMRGRAMVVRPARNCRHLRISSHERQTTRSCQPGYARKKPHSPPPNWSQPSALYLQPHLAAARWRVRSAAQTRPAKVMV